MREQVALPKLDIGNGDGNNDSEGDEDDDGDAGCAKTCEIYR